MLKKVLSDSLIGGIDEIINRRPRISKVLKIKHEIPTIETIRLHQSNQIIDIEITAIKQGRNKGTCFHKCNGEEIKHDFSTAVIKPSRQGGATEQPCTARRQRYARSAFMASSTLASTNDECLDRCGWNDYL